VITSALASFDWRFRLARFLERSLGVVLVYHSIDGMDGYAGTPPLTLEHFTRQLELLDERYPFSSLEELVQSPVSTRKRVALTFDDGYRSFIDKALPVLNERAIPATVFVCSDLLGTRQVITRAELRELARLPGIEIGNHTRTHVDLLAEPSRDILEREIVGGKKDLEDMIGIKVTSFSYPYGRVSPLSKELVRLSHARAVTVIPGVIWPSTDPFALNRVEALGIPISRFAYDLTDVSQRLHKLRRRRVTGRSELPGPSMRASAP